MILLGLPALLPKPTGLLEYIMYHILVETTHWTNSNSDCNHVYLFEDKPKGKTGKSIGYIRRGTDEVVFFRNGLTIDFRNRNFVEVKKVKI